MVMSVGVPVFGGVMSAIALTAGLVLVVAAANGNFCCICVIDDGFGAFLLGNDSDGVFEADATISFGCIGLRL